MKESVADIATLGHIDLLINNAGQPSFKVPTAYEPPTSTNVSRDSKA